MSKKFMIKNSNTREKTIDVLEKHCGRFEGYNPELIEFVQSNDVLGEIIDSIEEGLDNLNSRVSFNCSAGDFDVDIEVTVCEIEQDSIYASSVLDPKFSRLVKLYIFAEDYSVDEDYVICDDVYYRIDMLRED